MTAANDDRQRILHVVPKLGLGGAVRVVLDLIAGLEQLGVYEQHLCVLGRQGRFFDARRLARPPVQLDYSGAWRNPLETRRIVNALCRVMDEVKPAILHTHLWPADMIGAAAAGRTAARHLVHVHDTRPWLASPRLRHRLRRMITRRRLSRSRAEFVACSEAVKEYTCRCLGMASDRVCVVHYGTDTQQFDLGQSPRAFANNGRPLVVGTAGRFDWEKGHEYLFRAVAELARQGCAVRVRVAGDGKLRGKYEALIRQLRLEDRVELVGAVQDMRAFYRSLDIFVLPSVAAEGLPLTILEALALATPTVATTVAGVPEVIRDRCDGLLVAPGDVQQLTAAIARLAGEPAFREALGTSARQRILERHTLGHMVDGVMRVYQRLLSPAS